MTLFASASPGEVRVAAVAAGRLVDYALQRPGGGAAPGDLYRGRVTARAPALAGAFVDLGRGPSGFLPDSAGGATATEGATLTLRVVRAAQGGKGPRLAAAADLPCLPGPPGRLAAGPDAVARLAALHPTAPLVLDDAALAATVRPPLRERLTLVRRAFDDDLEAQVAALAEPVVELPGGGRLVIEPTSALVAIDVDTGAAAGARGGKTATHLAANHAAVAEIARQLRLRALGGPIVVDLAGLSPRGRAALAPSFERHLAADPAGPRFLGFSALGLAEILRPRAEAPLHELLGGGHAAALAGLRALDRAIAADPAWAPRLWVAPDVAEALLADPAALADLARRCGQPPRVAATAALPPRHWSLHAP